MHRPSAGGVIAGGLFETVSKELLASGFRFNFQSVERLAYTYNDVPMELRRGLYRTDNHHYHNQLS